MNSAGEWHLREAFEQGRRKVHDLPQRGGYSESGRPEVARHIPVTARSALDVGCGTGGFGRSLRGALGADARIVGLDPVGSSVQISSADRGYDEVLHGYFPTALEHRDERYDLVVFNDVLEHVNDPWSMLKEAKRVLSPGGSILAAIPNIAFLPVIVRLARGRWDYTDEGTLDRTHVRFFTLATAREMFEDVGLVIEVAEGANSLSESKPLLRPLMKFAGHLQYLHVVVRARLPQT